MDDCSGQNKNWSILTAMVSAVNSGYPQAKSITFKYLEAGPTFMSANTVHAGVERQMRAAVSVYDFPDFECVEKVLKTAIITSSNEAFKFHKGAQSHPKLNGQDRHLLAFNSKRAVSGSIWTNKSYEDEHFVEFDVLKKKVDLRTNPQPIRPESRGIPVAKKGDIITKLCPLMPENRRVFWDQLLFTEMSDLNKK